MRTSLTLRRLFGILTAAGVLASAAPAGAASEATGEPFFSRSGNSGYNVSHYEVHLGYAPRSGVLHARDTIEARATANLKRFTLDLDGLKVSSVSFDGEAAAVGRGRGKIKIRPAEEIEAGSKFTVDVRYGGVPRKVTDPDGSTEGLYRTRDGAVAVGEPVGTAAWLACNNTLRDKATFDVSIAVPRGLKAVSNGRLVRIGRLDGRREFFWQERQPMVPYLALVDIGKGKLEHGHIGKLPTWTLVDPSLFAKSQPALNSLPEAIRFEEHLFGPYPFDAAGSVVDAADLEYALETQTRPIYAFAPDRTTLVHETAHQWFGDSVGLERWPNIWLNEGLATWTEWYFAERHGGQTGAEVFAKLYNRPASEKKFWNPPSGHPGQAKNLFVTSTYVRGAMTIEALRQQVGTRDVLKLLRRWATERRYGHGDISDFVALASEVSGRDLGPFFRRWLFQRGKPKL